MSIDHSIYIGPYLLCEYDIETVSVPFDTCVNKNCTRYKHERMAEGKYCPACGDRLGEAEKEENRPTVDQWDIADVTDEGLTAVTSDKTPPKTHIAIPNRNFGLDDDSRWSDPTVEGVFLMLSPGDIVREEAIMSTSFLEEIQNLKGICRRVTLVWGVVVSHR